MTTENDCATLEESCKRVCIEFMGHTFSPEFLHQPFPQGLAPGTRIQIQLAPSAATCQVTIKRERDVHEREKDENFDNGQTDMSRNDILTRLSMCLPPQSDSPQVLLCSLPKNSVILKEYTVDHQDFVLARVHGADADHDYHDAVQKLALCFIESASDVDITQDGWDVVYLFLKVKQQNYALAGYMTLYHFEAPFRKPTAGTVVRICQALLLPPFQRRGHGQVMLRESYESYRQDEVVEINVEDPAPAFEALRNLVDYQYCRSHYDEWWSSIAGKEFLPLTAGEAEVFAARAKLTPQQVIHVYEMIQLERLHQKIKEGVCDDDNNNVTKQYRLMVKKRLQKSNMEDVLACETKEERQKLLSDLYDKTIEQYERILKRVGKTDVG